jgi:hypothetical protein
MEAAERLVWRMGLEGYAEVEFRRDAAGRAALMEANPRLSASVETATRAGVDFPVLLYDWARGAPLTRVKGYRTGVRLRWLPGDLRWLRETWQNPQHPDAPSVPRAATAIVVDTVRPSAYDLVDVHDLRPAARMVAKLLGRRGSDSVKRSSTSWRDGRRSRS